MSISGATPWTVLVPLPSAELSPNGRLHWAAKSKAVKAARRESWYWFQHSLPRDWIRVPVVIDVVYHCPKASHGYRPRDIENAISAMKPMIDGMVDAGVIPDDNAAWLEWGKFKLSRVKNGDAPGVYVTVIPRPITPIHRGVRPGEHDHAERRIETLDT